MAHDHDDHPQNDAAKKETKRNSKPPLRLTESSPREKETTRSRTCIHIKRHHLEKTAPKRDGAFGTEGREVFSSLPFTQDSNRIQGVVPLLMQGQARGQSIKSDGDKSDGDKSGGDKSGGDKSGGDKSDGDKSDDKREPHVIHSIVVPAFPMPPFLRKREDDCATTSQQHDGVSATFLTMEERNYLDTVSPSKRKRVLSRLEEAMQSKSKQMPIRLRIVESNLPNKREILSKLGTDKKFEPWVEAALRLPLGVYSHLRDDPLGRREEISETLRRTKARMDDSVHGHDEAKNQILCQLCKWLHNPSSPFNLALEGEPGIGKTTLITSVLADAFQRPCEVIALGGAIDVSYLIGHSYTYEGAIMGRIAEAVSKHGVMDPILYFDEVDKISRSLKGEDLFSVLMQLTDPHQSRFVRDRYFFGIDLDLSRATMVFSYNNGREIPSVLRDRLNVVHLSPPSVEEKVTIAKQHLIPRALRQASSSSVPCLDDSTIRRIVEKHTDEAGVRGLERKLRKVIDTLRVTAFVPELVGFVDKAHLTRKIADTEIDKILSSPRRHRPSGRNSSTSMMYT